MGLSILNKDRETFCQKEGKVDIMDTYIDVLLTSLKKKKNVLEKLDRVIVNQEQVLKLPKVNIDDLDELQKQKGDLIAEIEQLEEGFEKVYIRAGEELSKERQKYRFQIEQMQGYIKEITDLTVKIQAQEERNRQYMEMFFKNKKREIRQYNFGNRRMAEYSQHSADPVMGQSYFLNRKK